MVSRGARTGPQTNIVHRDYPVSHLRAMENLGDMRHVPSSIGRPSPARGLASRDQSFDISEPEAYRNDLPNTIIQILEGGHFPANTAADEIAMHIRSRSKKRNRDENVARSTYPRPVWY